MKRRSFFPLLLILLTFSVKASHITGGEMYYVFNGINNGLYQYTVTLKLFQRCGSGRQFPNPTIISVFDKTTNGRVNDFPIQISSTTNITITNPDPCISNPPAVCYDVAFYTFSIALPASSLGYILASQVNFRINGITNLSSGGNLGATYSAEIPGTTVANGPQNTSANFIGSDLVVVCANNNFSYSFAAQDADGDALRYSFCTAHNSNTSSGGGASPTGTPPFQPVPYGSPFTEFAPLGPLVQINSATGLITGIAPDVGIYVVTVCVEEVRNGVVIAMQRKDLQINIADCAIAAASLLPEYMLCRNSQTITIGNQSNSPLIVSTEWEFSNSANTNIYSTSSPTATYTFPTTGVYTVKLIINRNQPCTDSATALIRVFPGFIPDFLSTGICFNKPTVFLDNSTSILGRPNTWKWDFGESSTSTDNSPLQNPTYTYPTMGIKTVQLVATDTRGCRDTIYKNISIIDKPPLGLLFSDTMICRNDNLQLQASGAGNFSWTPPVNIINANTATPTVSPVTNMRYYVNLDNNGCLNSDSILITVVNGVNLQAMTDTTICRGDTIQLRTVSDGLQYTWIPAASFINPLVKNPLVISNNVSNTYQVTARIGGCSATGNIVVTTVPYPLVNAGADFSICNNTVAQLNGITNASSWKWSPANLVSNANILNPVSYPPRTTNYILTVFDTRGCPKPSRDTFSVTVLPKMNVFAGNDTAVIANQPLQLNATGGINYDWTPSTYLSATDIANPVAVFPFATTGIRYKLFAYNPQGCKDSANITINVFKTPPIIYVPSAFTPNDDGTNDRLRPLAVGIKNIEDFSIYNRWGQLLFSTKINGAGWDGKINGLAQSSGTFVWTVKAIDYTGKVYFQKGTFTLLR